MSSFKKGESKHFVFTERKKNVRIQGKERRVLKRHNEK
jgi:hypothetical protein